MSLRQAAGPFIISLLLLAPLFPAANAPAAPNDEALAILQEAGAFYSSQPTLAADVVVTLELPPEVSQMGAPPPLPYQFWFRSPNSFALIPPPGSMISAAVQDGERFYTEIPMAKMAVLRGAVPLEFFLTEEGKRYLQGPGSDTLLGLGLGGDTPGSLRSLTGVELVGEEQIDGLDCRRLTVNDPTFKGTIWVAKGDKPWVTRIHKPAPEQEPGSSGKMMIRPGLDIRISGWDADPDFGQVFDITPDPDLDTRDTLPTREELMAQMNPGNRPGGGGASGADHASVDKPAPQVTLQKLGGGEVALADLKGKIVVLDFWATWCKPCVMALPAVSKMALEMADQGVEFIAVNQRESSAMVTDFLKKMELDIPVALDKSAAAGRAFGVNGIPHSVIIDKLGVVRKVHVGFGPGMEKMLKMEIEELLAE